MSELSHHFIDELICPDRARDWGQLHVRRHVWNEVFGIKLAQCWFPYCPRSLPECVNVSILNHRGEGIFSVVSVETRTAHALPRVLAKTPGLVSGWWLPVNLLVVYSLFFDHVGVIS
jgi:hypothetical protein